MSTWSDEKILEWLKNGVDTERGFKTLVEKYQEKLYWHVRRMVTDHEDTNDVLQNVFIKVYRNIHRFEARSQLYTWLYRIATNETITFLNKKARKATDSIDNTEYDLAQRLHADPYFDGDAITVLLHQALHTLPDRQKVVFNMRYFDEMSYKEISEVLNTSVGGLKASYHHAVKKIEHYVKNADIEK